MTDIFNHLAIFGLLFVIVFIAFAATDIQQPSDEQQGFFQTLLVSLLVSVTAMALCEIVVWSIYNLIN